MSSTFNCNVDTSPMANQINRVSGSVGAVGSVVTAMQAAVVNAEMKAAQEVCDNVTYGFYMLTINQTSQKMVVLKNQVTTSMTVIQNYMKELNKIQCRMERDYNLISRQYLNIFRRLDDSLQNSIRNLDVALLDLMDTVKKEMGNRRLTNAVNVSTYSSEILPASQMVALTAIKQLSSNLLGELETYIKESQKLQVQIVNFTDPEPLADSKVIYFPVVISEVDSFVSEDSITEVALPSFPEVIKRNGLVVNTFEIQQKISENRWSSYNEEDKEIIKSHFLKLLTGMDKETSDIMQRLFESSPMMGLRR